jgi:hypothetical protein
VDVKSSSGAGHARDGGHHFRGHGPLTQFTGNCRQTHPVRLSSVGFFEIEIVIVIEIEIDALRSLTSSTLSQGSGFRRNPGLDASAPLGQTVAPALMAKVRRL